MPEVCKRVSCSYPAAPGQAYCCRECSPYGNYGMADRVEQNANLMDKLMSKVGQLTRPSPTPKNEHIGKAIRPEPQKYVKRTRRRSLKPGNGRMAVKFTNSMITLLMDPDYLKSWNSDSLSKVSNRMRLISIKLDEELQSRPKKQNE